MNGCIAPSFIEETALPVQVVKVVFVFLAPEKLHVANLKIRPEVTGGVSVCLLRVVRSPRAVCQPLQHVIFRQVLGMCSEEFLGGGPESRNARGSVKEINRETIGQVAVFHVPEHVVVDVAEELNLGFDTPIIAVFLECRVSIEHAAVPAAHLMV